MKRYLWECGKFSVLLVKITYLDDDGEVFKNYVDPNQKLLRNILVSFTLDIGLAGSEIFHGILHNVRSKSVNQVQQVNTQTGCELQEKNPLKQPEVLVTNTPNVNYSYVVVC